MPAYLSVTLLKCLHQIIEHKNVNNNFRSNTQLLCWLRQCPFVLFTCVASLYLLLCDIPVTTPTTPTTPTPTTTVRFFIKFRVSRCKIYTLEGTGSNQEKLPVFNFIR